MEIGDRVIDVDDDDPDLAVVVHRPDATIADRTVTYGGDERTVAADNPDYPADDPAVVVAFVESGLDSELSGWREDDPAELHDRARENDVSLYTFPESRLNVLDEGDPKARLDDFVVDMPGLRDRLVDAGWDLTMDEGKLVAENMRERYTIHPTGHIEGDGDVRGPLENIVQQYVE